MNVSFDGREHEAGMWNIFESKKCKALKDGRDIILDACHMSPQARWHSLQGPNGRHRKICVVFDLPLRTVQDRCIKTKRLSMQEAERMWKAFHDSMPTIGELKKLGFDDVYFLTAYPVCSLPAVQKQRISGRCCFNGVDRIGHSRDTLAAVERF